MPCPCPCPRPTHLACTTTCVRAVKQDVTRLVEIVEADFQQLLTNAKTDGSGYGHWDTSVWIDSGDTKVKDGIRAAQRPKRTYPVHEICHTPFNYTYKGPVAFEQAVVNLRKFVPFISAWRPLYSTYSRPYLPARLCRSMKAK